MVKYRVKIGNGSNIKGWDTVFEGKNVIGSNTCFRGYIGRASYIGENAKIHAKIGRFCSIASGVSVVVGKHPTSVWVSTHPAFFSGAKQAGFTYVDDMKYQDSYCGQYPVEIGNDVWIGERAMILQDVKIGDGAIIAAGAIVTSDVPAYAIVGGVPAKLIRYRFSPDQIDFLEKFKWWDKTDAWLQQYVTYFESIDKMKSIAEGEYYE